VRLRWDTHHETGSQTGERVNMKRPQGFGAGRGVCSKSKQSAMPLDPLSRALR